MPNNSLHRIKNIFDKYDVNLYQDCFDVAKDYYGKVSGHGIYSGLLIIFREKLDSNKLEEIDYHNYSDIIELSVNQGGEIENASIIGFLESLTNNPQNKAYKKILPYLGKNSIQAIKDLDQFWGTKSI